MQDNLFIARVHQAMDGLINWDTEERRHALGRHRDFVGRPYRRGAQRCRYCGAKLPANETLDPIPYRTTREHLHANLERENALLRRLQGSVGAP